MGLLMQVLVASAITLLLRAFIWVVRVVAILFRGRRGVVRLMRTHAPEILLRGADLLVGARRRAPPAPLRS
jgi:hypothetical protein